MLNSEVYHNNSCTEEDLGETKEIQNVVPSVSQSELSMSNEQHGCEIKCVSAS
jgi:hypothetical protein